MTASPSSIAPPEPPRPQAAVGLTVMFALQFLGAGASLARGDTFITDGGESHRDAMISWDLLRLGVTVAALALGVAGGFELWRRAYRQRGSARLGAGLVLTGTGALLAATVIAQLLYRRDSYLVPSFTSVSRVTSLRWFWSVEATCWLAVSAGLSLCLWRRREVRWLIAPLLVLSCAAFPGALMMKLYAGTFGTGRILLAVRSGAALLYFVTAYVALVSGAALSEISGWSRAADGLLRVARAARAKLGLICASIVLGLIILITSSIDEALVYFEVIAYFLPLIFAVLTFLIATGALSAAGLTTPGAPRFALYLAGGLLAATSAISAARAWHVYAALPRNAPELHVLPVLVPMASGLAILVLASALRRMAAAEQLQARSTGSTLFFAVLIQMFATALYSKTGNDGLWFSLLANIAELVVLVQLARLAQQLVNRLRDHRDVPQAIVIS